MAKSLQKIAIIGNTGGGKTTLARRLAKLHGLPVTHVDSVQFLPGMKIRPHAQSIEILDEVQTQDEWIIDGYGPLDILEERLGLADQIVMLDFPLWHHAWWCTKRQLKNYWSPRAELPAGCSETSWAQTRKLFKTLKTVHEKMRPEMLRILQRPELAPKVIYIRNKKQWNQIFDEGLRASI
ncbi:MAG: isopentenyl transferase family protein [Bdellovibrio sp.]|jgi:adenylate kinase family enzyme